MLYAIKYKFEHYLFCHGYKHGSFNHGFESQKSKLKSIAIDTIST